MNREILSVLSVPALPVSLKSGRRGVQKPFPYDVELSALGKGSGTNVLVHTEKLHRGFLHAWNCTKIVPSLILCLMTVTLILAIAVGVGAGTRRWWALLLPLLVGCVSAAVVSMSGHRLADTPIPFLVVTATLAMAIGILLRTRLLRHSL